MFDQEEILRPTRELSKGEQIQNLLDGLNPVEKKMALREAEERIHKSYAEEMEKINSMSSALEKEWNEFKNG